MKVENQFPAVGAIEPQERRQTQGTTQVARPRKAQRAAVQQPAAAERGAGKSASFNIQLNQQLSSMQSAESYLGELAGRLGQLKLSLGRELSSAQGVDRQGVKQQVREVNELLAQRSERSGQSLDATLKLRLHEPVRARFTLQGLESIADVQRAGRETLLFSGGRKLAEPAAVVLDEQMSEQQILRRFNASLGSAGIRAELEQGGALKFSAREQDWQQLKGQLAVQGEGKLFPKGQVTRLSSEEDQLIKLSDDAQVDNQRELRRMLDNVINSLDKISALREQLRHRQDEIREFLARQADQNEQQWAMDYAGSVFNLMRENGASYAQVTQTVVAQANLSRFTVVSLLS